MKIALIGLGHMGVPIAERILAAGHDLTVWNRTPSKAEPLAERGARVAQTPRGLLGAVDVCITVVADDAALESVAAGDEGVLVDARPGAVLVDMSTVSPGASARVAEAAGGAGVAFLRAPVSGNPAVVRAGNLTIIVSGPRDAYDATLPLLETIGPNVLYVGDGEQARVIKLALNLMIAGTAELMGEALLLAERAGVDRATLLEVMGASAVGSPFVRYKSGPILEEDYSATFTSAMMAKDIDLARALADDVGATLPAASLLAERYRATIDAGYGEDDLMAVYLELRGNRARAGSGSGRGGND